MHKGRAAVIWLLILIPTILIGVGSLVLLRHEQERIEQASERALYDRAQLLVDDINVAVSSLQEGLLENLENTPLKDIEETLLQMERENPMIRNTFICKEDGQVLLPVPSELLSPEKKQFLSRYGALFTGRVAWIERKEEGSGQYATSLKSDLILQEEASAISQNDIQQAQEPSQQQQTEPQTIAQQAWGNARSQTIGSISKLARRNFNPNYKAAGSEWATLTGVEKGWMPWYWENEFYMLGYIQALQQGLCYGVEIEMMALLSRLVPALEPAQTSEMLIALEDKNGRIINYVGEGEIIADMKPEVTIPIGAKLPHYRISVYSAGFSYGGSAGQSFMIISSLLVGIFVLSIITGGIMLNAHAKKSQQDAIQKTSFVSNVSHELKTPLTTIRMYTELLHDERVKDPDKRSNYLKIILNESERLSRLVNNVLDFGRLEQGRKHYELTDINLNQLISEVMETQYLRLDKAGFKTTILLPDKPIDIQSDRDALEQVLINVTDNALKYAQAGKELTIQVTQNGPSTLIRIMDRGPSIPRAHQKKIFDKFHRVDDSLTAEKGGSGLGLSIAQRLLQDLNGKLIFEDREGGGAVFTITIPGEHGAEVT